MNVPEKATSIVGGLALFPVELSETRYKGFPVPSFAWVGMKGERPFWLSLKEDRRFLP